MKLEKLRQVDDELAGCRVLIVDDDVRNIFALTSILERHNIEVMHAENGRAGIDTLLQDARHRHRADGHHDARNGRVRDHPRRSRARSSFGTCRSSR